MNLLRTLWEYFVLGVLGVIEFGAMLLGALSVLAVILLTIAALAYLLA